jgi:uncharacterized protein YndB with AHSA1/START domain
MELKAPPGIDPLTRKVPPERPVTAICAGVLVAAVLYMVGAFVGKSYAAGFFATPLFVGAVVGAFSLRRPFLAGWITLGVALVLAIVTLQEGAVCVLYALPLLIPEIMLGAACGWVLRRHVRGLRNRGFLIALIVLAGAGWQVIEARFDDPAHHPVQTATSSLEIAAPPEQVFAALTDRPIEVAGRWPWFLRVGLPIPRRLEITPPRLRVDFSHGTAHGHVTTWAPPQALAFTIDRYELHDPPFRITRLGRGPHLGLKTERVPDWLTLLELRYALERTASGGTRLTRQTSWRRHLAPGFYFGWLQQQVITRGQRRLLELVRDRIPPLEPPRHTVTAAP